MGNTAMNDYSLYVDVYAWDIARCEIRRNLMARPEARVLIRS